MSTHTLYYVKSDGPRSSTWSVYSDEYASIDALQPIKGSARHVMTCPTRIEAERQAHRLQRESYRTGRAYSPGQSA